MCQTQSDALLLFLPYFYQIITTLVSINIINHNYSKTPLNSSVYMFLHEVYEVSYVNQGCVYLIKNSSIVKYDHHYNNIIILYTS